jgi:DNA-directed RNA polymerase subunit beta'
MAVHIPLSKKAQEEAIELMLPSHNLLKPADGSPITLPNKEMALGIFYLTSMDETLKKDPMPVFADTQEAQLAYASEQIGLKEPVQVRINGEIIETSVGRIMFNERLPHELGFINEAIKASGIKRLITRAIRTISPETVANLIDSIKNLGFYASTISGISVSVFDNEIVDGKDAMIEKSEEKVKQIENEYQQGLITVDERKRLSNDVWMKTTDEIADLTWNNLKLKNAIKVIIDSEGARAGKEQLKQLSAMRGLILDPLGKIVELPIKSNFREGLTIFEYVASARGSRKGLTDSALKTANAGYLTRRLVDVSHDVIITQDDCGTTEGISIEAHEKDREAEFSLRIIGRFTAAKVASKKTRKQILGENEEITEEKAKELVENEVTEITVRSALTCKLSNGLCAKCYGMDFSTHKQVDMGVPVGVMAAQSIGEPGTQLTMRVRHFGGVVMADVTQGLPRVEELFEMRTPKNFSPVSEIAGKVKIETNEDGYVLRVKNSKVKPVEEREYFIPLASELLVEDGAEITAGTAFARGYLDPKEVLKISGLTTTQRYILTEAQRVYESQGIAINDKHFEVILRKMSDKIIIETVGDTSFIPGDFVTKTHFEEVNAEMLAQGAEPATGRRVLLGITKAALFSDSWLSAASFQETTKVLTEAALEGREDRLIGLKENVIIGRLIPVDGGKVAEEMTVAPVENVQEAPIAA